MKIKTTLKKIKRGDILKINQIDAGDINDDSCSWFSEDNAENIFKEIPVETIAVYFGHGKENLFLVRDTEKQDISLHLQINLQLNIWCKNNTLSISIKGCKETKSKI